MNLQECLDVLARGKLSNLSLVSKGKVLEEAVPEVVDAINEGLRRIYTNLTIKENNVILELTESRTDYEITSEHSLRNWNPDDPFSSYKYYIRDTDVTPFQDDILVILEVWDDLGRKRPINDPDSPLGVYIDQPNNLSVNFTREGRVLNVIYRAKHLDLVPTELSTRIQLPENLYGALFSYVAYLLMGRMNTQEAVANSARYFNEYQSIINEITMNSTLNPDKLVSDSKFYIRGWV